MKSRERQTRSARTVAAQAGVGADRAYGAVSVPIYPSAIFRYEEFGKHQGFDYSRAENPTRRALEEVLAELEQGSRAVAFASGMAAVSATLPRSDQQPVEQIDGFSQRVRTGLGRRLGDEQTSKGHVLELALVRQTARS